MKQCMSCGIEVGGMAQTCPLCQNTLVGEDLPNNWPSLTKFKKQAFLYKLQMFIVLACSVVALSLDFLLDINTGKHWSLIVAATVFIFEVMLRGLLKKNIIIAKLISWILCGVAIVLLITGSYFGFLNVIIYTVLPIMIGVSLVVNFVFSIIDKTENALVYLLVNILVSVVPYVIFAIGPFERTLTWTICLMIGMVTFIGIAVFKGRKVLKEVQKRMNF